MSERAHSQPAEAPAAAAEAATESRYVLEEQIGFRLRKAHQRASEDFNAVMARFEVTPTQFAALAKLSEAGPLPQNQLGRLTAMDPATILGVVRRLAKRGYVNLRLDPTDARHVVVGLTREGEAAAARMRAVAVEVSARTLSALTRREAETLLRLVEKLG